jgi:virginiamycin A acetyltransferase
VPYSIVGGNPAQLLRMRFPEAKIEHLLKLQWWDWELEKITQNLPYLTGNTP